MSGTIYLPSKIVKEKYLRPAGLPDELINDIPVDFWGGEKNHLPMYGKDVVEKFMDDHRPKNPIEKSLKKEDFNMVDFGSVDHPLERIASCLEKLLDRYGPEEVEVVGTAYVASQLGCTPQWVTKLAERGEIPPKCILPKLGGGRIWKFDRQRIDEWLRQRQG